MKLERAIELLTIASEGWPAGEANVIEEYYKALDLGIEALKRIVYLRKDMDCPYWMTLPGETEK